jgi:hypothetical protein
MDSSTYQRWWELHVRASRGELLGPDEQRVYESGLKILDEEENLANPMAKLQQARAILRTREAELAALRERREKLDAEIAALEAALDAQTKQLLGVES